MRRALLSTLLILPLAAGCAAGAAGEPAAGRQAAAAAPTAMATLRDPGGAARGTARLTQSSGGLVVRVEAMGLPPGAHGLHIHMTGRCDAPDFSSAGGHWNPTGKAHGFEDPRGPHYGDLPNLAIGADGRGAVDYVVPGADLAGGTSDPLDADGAAMIIHAGPDDYRTDPSGNSGGRIACGVFRRS
jgi:Cu-Zn family superoxide dismutase